VENLGCSQLNKLLGVLHFTCGEPKETKNIRAIKNNDKDVEKWKKKTEPGVAWTTPSTRMDVPVDVS
jgi:nickel-dependent lactate racemase